MLTSETPETPETPRKCQTQSDQRPMPSAHISGMSVYVCVMCDVYCCGIAVCVHGLITKLRKACVMAVRPLSDRDGSALSMLDIEHSDSVGIPVFVSLISGF